MQDGQQHRPLSLLDLLGDADLLFSVSRPERPHFGSRRPPRRCRNRGAPAPSSGVPPACFASGFVISNCSRWPSPGRSMSRLGSRRITQKAIRRRTYELGSAPEER